MNFFIIFDRLIKLDMKRLFCLLAIALTFFAVSCGETQLPVDDVTVDPFDGSADKGSRYFRRSLAMTFVDYDTPSGRKVLDAVKAAQKERPGRIANVVIHPGYTHYGSYSTGLMQFYGVNKVPTLLLDFQDKDVASCTANSLTTYVDSYNDHPQCTGIRLEALVDPLNENYINLDVYFYITHTGTYDFGVLLLQDGVTIDLGGEAYYCDSVFYEDFFLTWSERFFYGGEIMDGHAPINLIGLRDHRQYHLVAYVFEYMDNGAIRFDNAVECPLFQTKELRYEKD